MTPSADAEETPASRTVVVMARLAHRNRARILDDGSAGPDPALLRALGRAHEWRGWMERGEAMSYRAIAKKAGVTSSYVQTILPLAFLAPSLTRELLDGRRQLRGRADDPAAPGHTGRLGTSRSTGSDAPVDHRHPLNTDCGLQGEASLFWRLAGGAALMVLARPHNRRVTPQSKAPGDFRPETPCSPEIPPKIPVSGVTPGPESAELCGVFG